MDNIIISGCSFSVDDTCLDVSHRLNSRNKNYISYPHYIKQNEDINVYNIARDAADNATISRNLINIVNELYNQGINYDDMFVIVQWSGIDRHSMYISEDYLCGSMFYKKEYNGYSLSSQESDKKHWEEYFSKIHTDKKALDFTITTIDKTQDFLKQKNIKYKMFCGWNLFDNKLDLEKYIDTTEFWFYEDAKGSYGLAQKWFKGKNKYGGMKEWVRDNLDKDDWTRGIHGVQNQDQHPSNKAQKKFYKKIISKLIGRKEQVNVMKKSDKIIGFHSGHDCSYTLLGNGIPVLHNELERFTRKKEHLGDAINFIEQTLPTYKDVKYFTHVVDNWKGGHTERYPDTAKMLDKHIDDVGGEFWYFGHHQSHAANAFFSSNFDEALIVTLDAGGWDFIDECEGKQSFDKEEVMTTGFTVSIGNGNNIKRLAIKDIYDFNIGGGWNKMLEHVFDLSTGYPYGNQAGTIMAMACMGDYNKYGEHFKDRIHLPQVLDPKPIKEIVDNRGEEGQFDISAAIQWSTEYQVLRRLEYYIKKYKPKNLCLAGGVSLNSVLVGKLYEFYNGIVENIYIPPVPYDAGLPIGASQILWHGENFMNQPRITWKDNSPTYLGFTYHEDTITEAIKTNKDKITTEVVDDETVIDLLTKDDNVISVYGDGSESGRRALGNRSILADPRNKNMKDIINDKVKHRQWFRPFAPSILREDVSEWFERDVDSPYMTTVIKFKEEVRDKVPAVVHTDGSARLQTVTENDNKWYYNFIKKFKEKTGVPIVLNTSFNDREPIVETPDHAINCFLRTDIDYLYFREPKILLKKI